MKSTEERTTRWHWIVGPLLLVLAAFGGLELRSAEADVVRASPAQDEESSDAHGHVTDAERSTNELAAIDHGRPGAVAPASSDPPFHAHPTHPRDPGEWQGRLQELTSEPCNDEGYCGRARACRKDGTCGPCLQEGDCLNGEACGLDHCVLADRLQCRSRAECEPGKYCILEMDAALGPRGNEGLWAVCQGSEKHQELVRRPAKERSSTKEGDEADLKPSIDVDGMRDRLLQELNVPAHKETEPEPGMAY